ncbi:hypothetical protein [Streptomyces sp. 039-1]|uniref:hypothetical protein n=1 Tax=Streptomyces sp. 039-1 TaxID=2789263 RepID=UPI0039F556F3
MYSNVIEFTTEGINAAIAREIRVMGGALRLVASAESKGNKSGAAYARTRVALSEDRIKSLRALADDLS